MNLYEFLTHADIQLPRRWDTHSDFETFVKQRFSAYLSLIDQLDPNAEANEVQRRKPSLCSCFVMS